MMSTITDKTLDALHSIFAAYELSEQLVSDNGPQFVSAEFKSCMKANGIKHIQMAPYHLASK